jgi:hypothetical protein
VRNHSRGQVGASQWIAPLLAKDNLAFFSMSAQGLEKFKKMLPESEDLRHDPDRRECTPLGRQFNKALTLARNWKVAFESDDYSRQCVLLEELDKHGLEVKLLFYLILKTTRRHNQKIDSDPWWEFYAKEANEHEAALEAPRDQRIRNERNAPPSSILAIGSGEYSADCFLDLSIAANKLNVNGKQNVLDLGESHQQDIDT